MKKIFLSLLVAAGVSTAAYANIACPVPATIHQPDGTQLTLVLRGDEFCHIQTTADGYTVVRCEDGSYQYALPIGVEEGSVVAKELRASGIVAHDAALRTEAEQSFLRGIQPGLRLAATEQEQQMRRLHQEMVNQDVEPANPEQPIISPSLLQSFRGLIILVNFNDRQFMREDANALFSDIANKEGFEGYDDENLGFQNYTGSLYDYFKDNSMGKFAPNFDVVGPVTIDYSVYYPQSSRNSFELVQAALNAVDSEVDFSQYDADGDGYVDMFYVIYAGYGANYSGNDSRYIWPHASNLSYSYIRKDGKYMGRFACSNEIYGLESRGDQVIEGIGTIVHEFSHVLGYADHYAVDYRAPMITPDEWDVMSGGSYLNLSRTPCGYTAYERYSAGFLSPVTIEKDQVYSLNPLNTHNEAYRLPSGATKKEYFLLENRQQTGWDRFIPGHGMLVWRVDSTSTQVWNSNKVNNNSNHLYLEVVRANPRFDAEGNSTATSGDTYPGSGKVYSLSDATTPGNLLSWNKTPSGYSLRSIKEEEGVITFASTDGEMQTEKEGFEMMVPFETSTDTVAVEGEFADWQFAKGGVVAFGEGIPCNGTNAALLSAIRGTAIATLNRPIEKLTLQAYNANSMSSKLQVFTRAAGETSWIQLTSQEGDKTVALSSGSSATVNYTAMLNKGDQIRFYVNSGKNIYMDDVEVVMGYEDPNDPGNEETSLETAIGERTTGSSACYNLFGVKVESLAPGHIYVRDGKKIVVR